MRRDWNVASELSAFAETDLLRVLPAIFGSIVITASVHHECRHPRRTDL